MKASRDLEGGWETLVVERREEILWVTLDDGGRANALGPAMVQELASLYEADLLGGGIRALVLRGAGKNFSAGADLEHLKSLLAADEAEQQRDSESLRRMFSAVLHQQALTVALVHGACVAGGCGLATAHDFLLSAEDARFAFSEVRIGFVPALVATFLRSRVSPADLRFLLLSGEWVDARRAREMGLVHRLVSASELEEAGRELVLGILERGSSASIARTKRLLLEIEGRTLDEALEVAAGVNAEARGEEDCRRGIETFLVTKATPNWRR